MKFTKKTPRKDIKIDGIVITLPLCYEEGHVCSSNEAHALAQTAHENIRNNLATRFKKMRESVEGGPPPEEYQREAEAYAAAYEFGVRATASSDPVKAEAMRLATDRIKNAIRKKGHKLVDFSAEAIRKLAANAITQHPVIMEMARERVAQLTAIGEKELDLEGV